MIDAERLSGQEGTNDDGTAIERRSAHDVPYETFLREYGLASRPVIIEDSVEHWPALWKWTPEFFKTHFGDRDVKVTDGVTMNFAELVDAVLASTAQAPAPYLHKLIISTDMPELAADVSPENAYGFGSRFASAIMPKPWNRPDAYLKLLFGGVGGKFPYTHFDGDNAYALITGIYGHKEFRLFAPSDAPYLYPKSDGPNVSRIADINAPDLEQFPLFERARCFRGVVGPGESIFIPARWWHAARVLDVSISVCTNMLTPANWPGFVREVTRSGTHHSPVRQVAKRAVLSTVGAAMSVAEGVRNTFPRAPFARALERIAPQAPATPRGARS